ncbi:ATP-binding protein [Kordiimonas lacus]|uniref:ATPase family associated with various cellular activities (AAA) n=1 Tax=Kordiimonas lacus TaxID=637679 RepID=A0A1G7A3W0_9PROT|nr:ATP-binding protein [Kordiimonas lacus]SDE09323.1 ATPase family associated with various cellular activities (AAA) [Kordiimonas lacus]
MVTENTTLNAIALEAELDWLQRTLNARLASMTDDMPSGALPLPDPPDVTEDPSPYGSVIRHYQMTPVERLVLITALVPHIRPNLFDCFLMKNQMLDRGFTEFGGLQGRFHSGFLPTGETILFLIAGTDLEVRFALQAVFDGTHFFSQHNILSLQGVTGNEPLLSGQITLSRTFIDYLTTGVISAPSFGPDFPAQKIDTSQSWDDLVLEGHSLEQIWEIRSWLQHGDTVMHDLGMSRRVKPGYRSLFYGPPGTGKSMTAALLGRESGYDVYRIDLSMVTSKYIGETEKNLARVFDYAMHHRWILFFDEADALFGKRTETKDAHDRYANQETAYLLQRVEDYDGVAILATNQKSNIDNAFTRRFHTIIHFPMPDASNRYRIWMNAFSERVKLEDQAMLENVALLHEISGGAIMNVARYAALKSAERGDRIIRLTEIEAGIHRELEKEGRQL